MRARQKSFDEVLFAWAASVPQEMQKESPHNKLLDSFLRLFDNLSAANITRLPPKRQMFQSIRRAMHWQWIALNIPAPSLASMVAPLALSMMIVRWLTIWKNDKTIGQSRLMAAIDRDLNRAHAAVQYALRS